MTRFVSTLAALTLAAPLPLVSQALPSATQVHAKYIEALGGRDAIAGQKHRTTYGHFEVPAQGLTGPITIYTSAPNLVFTRIEIPGIGEITSGYDGETAWSNNPMMGPMLVEGKALDQMKQQADMYASLNPERFVKAAEVVKVTEFQGKRCYELKVTTNWDETYTEYYDVATGLLHAMVRTQASPAGDLEATSVFTNYAEHEGMKSPGTITVNVMGMTQVVVTDSVSFGAIPAARYELPQAIKALKK